MRDIFTELPRSEWSELDVAAAVRCIPGMALPLLLGLYTGHLRFGVLAAGGAFCVGFGSFRRVMQSRRVAMLAAALGVAVSCWVGSVAGLTPVTSVAAAGLWGLLYGVFSAISDDAGWVVLQCVIWLVVSTSAPLRGIPALTRCSLVLIGGLIQFPLIVISWKLVAPRVPAIRVSQPMVPVKEAVGALRESTWLELYPAQCALTLMLGMAISRSTHWENSYWIPMTSSIVLRPAFTEVVQRGLLRTAGTLCGAGLAATLTLLVHPHALGLVALVLIFALGSYLLVYVNPALFAIAVTPYVVFLLALAGLPGASLIRFRALDTLIGGALALPGHALIARLAKQPRRRVHA